MATYYVDSSRSDDSGNGTSPETAKKTIAAAVALISANGDTLRFVGGSEWNESLVMVNYNYITYEAYGAGNTPIIRAGTVLNAADWTGPDGNGCWVNPGTGLNCTWLIEEGHLLKKGSDATLPEGNGTWWCAGTYEAPIYYKPTGGGDPRSNGKVTQRLSGAIITSPWPGTGTNAIIDGMSVKFGIINIYGGTNNLSPITIKNCQFTEAFATAIYVNNGGLTWDSVIIDDCVFDACNGNIYLVSEGSGYFNAARVRRNTITKSNYLIDGTTVYSTTGDQDGMSIQTIKDTIIEDNNISGNCVNSDGDSGAISCWCPAGLTLTGNIIRRNFVHSIQGTGIVWAGADAPTFDCQIYNNIVTDFGEAGIYLAKAQTATTKSGIYNNTIANGVRGIEVQAQADYYLIKNNIVYNCDYAVALESGWGDNMVANHNAYYHPTSLQFLQTATAKTLAQYQAIVTPDDSDAVTDNPSFVNAGGSYALDTDFRLQSTSPCVNTGDDVGLTADYDGNEIAGLPDIGAYEYQPTVALKIGNAGVRII